MQRLLLVTPGELTRDPRARRAAAAAVAAGLEVTGLCVNDPLRPPFPLAGVRIERGGTVRMQGRAGPPAVTRRGRLLLRELRGLYRLIRLAVRTVALLGAARRIDAPGIVHANDFDALGVSYLVARRNGARLVYDAHELYTDFDVDPPRIYRSVVGIAEGVLARRADAVVTVSAALADELHERLRLRARPLVVLNAPPLSGGDPSALARDGVRVVYAGVFGTGRSVDDLVAALVAAPSATLTVFDAGGEAASLRQAAARRGVEARIDVRAPVPPEELVEALREFDVGLVFDRPVTRNAELALPNKLFEYLMAGLAIVAPRLPAIAEVVDGAGAGVLVEPGRPDAAGAAIERLAADRELLLRCRLAARRAAVTHYNAEASLPELVEAWGV